MSCHELIEWYKTGTNTDVTCVFLNANQAEVGELKGHRAFLASKSHWLNSFLYSEQFKDAVRIPIPSENVTDWREYVNYLYTDVLDANNVVSVAMIGCQDNKVWISR